MNGKAKQAMKEQKIYRVFLTRCYIMSDYVEVKSTSPSKAKARAEKYITKARPDVRLAATDNLWHAEEPVTLDRIGQYGVHGSTHPMREADKDIFVYDEKPILGVSQ
jgi:hypothetical protein